MSFAAERILRVGDWRHAIQEVLPRLGEAAGVDRIVVFENQPGEAGDVLVSRRYEWVATPQYSRPAGLLQNISMRAAGFDRWLELLPKGGIVASHVRNLPASEQPILLAQGIQSALVVPILIDTEWWGFFGFDACAAKRIWNRADIEALSAAARLLGEAIRHERAAVALRTSETRYRTLAESAQDAIFIVGRDLRVQYVNQSGARSLGQPSANVLGKRLDELFPSDIAHRYGEAITRVLTTGEPVYIEGPGHYAAGDVQLSTQLVALRNDDGTVTAALGVSRDLTERRRAEQAQQESQARLHALTETVTDAVVVANASGTIVLWNQGAERLFQYAKDEAVGLPISRLISEPQRSLHESGMQRFQTTGEARLIGKMFEGVGLRKDGTTCPVELSLALWQEAGGQFVGAIIRDISARKQAEAALQEREADLREAQRVARVGSWEWTIKADTLTWSDELYRIHLLDPHSPLPHFDGLERYFPPKDWTRLRAAIDHAQRTGEPFELDLQRIRVDGTTLWTTTRGEAMRDEHGRIVGIRGSVLDITERKRAEDALRESETRLRQAQKMEAVGQLAGGVAHDFNNLLTAICGYADLVMENLEDGGQMRADVAEIRKAGDRAAALTRQLLAFGRRQVFQPRVLDLGNVMADVEAMLRRVIGENIAFTSTPGAELAPIFADPTQIEQILLNLAVNARDAMPDGGTLSIEATNVEVGEKDMAACQLSAPTGHYVALAVRDTGCGMPPEVKSHIFEPFFTTKGPGKGTGLGLSTVYGIVKQMNGGIDVESDVGRGTTFRVYLPASDGVVEAAAASTPAAASRRGSEAVLIVEDEQSVRVLVARTLRHHGYTVLEAGNPEEALAILARHPDPIQLLITDLIMPGMNGHQLASHVSSRYPLIKTLLISGYAADTAGREISPTGGHIPFMQKPFTPAALLETVRKTLDGQPPGFGYN